MIISFISSLNETLTGAIKDEDSEEFLLHDNTNFNSIAFIIWSNSSLQRESINSAVMIFDKDMQETGRFGIGIRSDFRLPPKLADYSMVNESEDC